MKKWQQNALLIAGTIGVMYGMIYVDVVSRAREAYQEGERYWNWTEHPDQRAQYLQTQLSSERAALDQKLASNKISKDDYDREIELLQFEHDQQIKESTIKYAYIWYQTAAEQFSPPNSKWVQLARSKMPVAKERWKAELRAKNIPFEDYMID
jgi:hypothetical protein